MEDGILLFTFGDVWWALKDCLRRFVALGLSTRTVEPVASRGVAESLSSWASRGDGGCEAETAGVRGSGWEKLKLGTERRWRSYNSVRWGVGGLAADAEAEAETGPGSESGFADGEASEGGTPDWEVSALLRSG